MNFSTKLKEFRNEKGLTLKSVAMELSIPLTTYANYEQGTREPSIAMIIALCNFYDVSADYLIGRSDNY